MAAGYVRIFHVTPRNVFRLCSHSIYHDYSSRIQTFQSKSQNKRAQCVTALVNGTQTNRNTHRETRKKEEVIIMKKKIRATMKWNRRALTPYDKQTIE